MNNKPAKICDGCTMLCQYPCKALIALNQIIKEATHKEKIKLINKFRKEIDYNYCEINI